MEVDAADMDTLKKYAGPLLMLAIFETVTITLWLALYAVSYTHLTLPTT